MSDSKQCTRCRRVLSMECFTYDRSRLDHKSCWCRDCARQYHRDRKAMGSSARAVLSTKKIITKAKREGKTLYWGEDMFGPLPEGLLESFLLPPWDKESPNELKARLRVAWLVKEGKLPPIKEITCHSCQEPAVNYHHYLGYAEEHWGHVIPLCSPCHGKTRRKAGRKARKKPQKPMREEDQNVNFTYTVNPVISA